MKDKIVEAFASVEPLAVAAGRKNRKNKVFVSDSMDRR